MSNRIVLLPIILFLFLSACTKLELEPDHTQPVVVEADSITFAVIGDYGDTGDPEKEVSELVKSWSPDFIITLGDNNYPDGELSTIRENISQYYCDFIFNPDAPEGYQCFGIAYTENQNRFFPSLGNHDFRSRDINLPYLNFFSLPGKEVYYEFKWGPVHFFVLNSGRNNEAQCCESEQALWLEEKLSASEYPFRIVYFHHPPYSSSKHGNAENMQWPFAEWGATAVLGGHNHVYERIVKFSEPNLLYLVNGVGGRQSFYDCEANPLDQNHFESLCIENNFGAIKGKATSDQLLFEFFSIDDPHSPLDQVVIRN